MRKIMLIFMLEILLIVNQGFESDFLFGTIADLSCKGVFVSTGLTLSKGSGSSILSAVEDIIAILLITFFHFL